MKLFEVFTKKSPNFVFFSVVLGVLAGMSYSALIPLLLAGITPQDPKFDGLESSNDLIWGIEVAEYSIAATYFIACFLILLARAISEIMLIRVSTDVTKDFRFNLYDQISYAPVSSIEKIGASRLIASINIDVPRVVAGARLFPSILINLVSVVGMLGFLLYLNPDIFKLVILAIFIGVCIYQLPRVFANRLFMQVRTSYDDLQKGVHGLIYGAKELKINERKRAEFYKVHIERSEQEIKAKNKSAQSLLEATTSFGELICFLVIGLVSFVFINYYSITKQELVGVIMILLYIIGPIGIIINSIPTLAQSFVSYQKVKTLLAKIPRENIDLGIHPVETWRQVSFKSVEYSYDQDGDERGFHIGPLDFTIKKGEITFLVGGNGSGKSTLSKLITLHNMPSDGQVYFGNSPVTASNINSYRQEICAIYSDYFLFDRILTELSEDALEKAHKYLKELHLEHKVEIHDGQFSTISLSDGQKKRLALLVAFLEDKPLYLFDEWAADQDPVFKDLFYRQILPDLKRQNKTIVVISHDEHYFWVADQILTMNQGVLSQQRTVQQESKKEVLASESYK